MSALTRGKVARLADVGPETVRYYEREGLIASWGGSGSNPGKLDQPRSWRTRRSWSPSARPKPVCKPGTLSQGQQLIEQKVGHQDPA